MAGKKRTIVLPRTQAQADKLASGLAAEVTEKEWGLAALVFAQVLPHGKRKPVSAKNGKYELVSTTAFAARGIRGLTNHQTVARYRDTYQAAVDAGLAPDDIQLGDTIELPDVDFHEYYPGDPRDGSPERHIAKELVEVTPERAKAAWKANPAVREAVREAVSERVKEKIQDDQLRRIANGEKITPHPIPEKQKDPAFVSDGGAALQEEVERRNAIGDYLEWAQAGADLVDAVMAHNFTGVADEIEWIKEANTLLADYRLKTNGFIVETPTNR